MASFAIRELIIAQSDAKQFDAHTVLGSILLGHKPTEVHSTMVAHLTKALIRRLIDTDPAAVVGLKGCKNVAEVAARKAELLDTAYECGLYHDVGKSAVILNIDNNGPPSYRRGVSGHPDPPGHWLWAAAGGRVRQVHGPGGPSTTTAFITAKAAIPKDVPPCPPEVKVIVDALSVADSLDAATDNIGRCYQDGQAFSARWVGGS